MVRSDVVIRYLRRKELPWQAIFCVRDSVPEGYRGWLFPGVFGPLRLFTGGGLVNLEAGQGGVMRRR